MVSNNTNIIKIVEWLSENVFGTKEDPGDVQLKYLIEDEKEPYWWIPIDFCQSFYDYKKMNDVIESFSFRMCICGKGIWLKEKKFVMINPGDNEEYGTPDTF